MEYYDHNIGREESQRRDPGYRDYSDQYGSYRTSYKDEEQKDARQYRDYRKNHSRGRGNNYLRYSRSGGRAGYQRGDRDFRDDIDMRSDQTKNTWRNSRESSFNGERNPRQTPKDFESDNHYVEENKLEIIANSNQNLKRTNMSYHASHYEGDSDVSISDEMDLEKELLPISHYLENDDREEMLIQVFKVIRGPKLRAMLTSVLKDIDLTELKLLCLEQLEGMSKKRIRAILAGEEMQDSSATEDEEDESRGDKEDDNEKVNDIYDNKEMHEQGKEIKIQVTSSLNKDKNVSASNPESAKVDNKAKNADRQKKKHIGTHVLGNMSGVVQFKSGGRSLDKIRNQGRHPSSSSEEELETVIASGNAERKRKHELKEKITKTKKIGFKVGKRTNSSSAGQEKCPENELDSSTKIHDNTDRSGKTLMELLELEMRARAIKALLGNKDGDTCSASAEKDKGQEDNNEPENLERLKESPEELSKDDNADVHKQMDEEKHLQKAREQLHISGAKKREEEEIVERKHAEIRTRLEEQQKTKDAEESETKQKEKEEAERMRKTQKKQEEYEKFLMWKEDRQRKKGEKQRFELKRQEEDEWYTRQAVKQKQRQMVEKETEEANEKSRINKSTELKRSKIDRVEVTEDWKVAESDAPEIHIETKEEETSETPRVQNPCHETDKCQGEGSFKTETSEKCNQPRRYRRKHPVEDGQLPSDDSDHTDDLEYESDYNSFSESKSYSGSDTTLSNTEPSDKDDEEKDNKRIELIRRKRAEIRRKNRRRKPAADIEEGEVDSDGEHFEPMEESRDPKIRMILHHLPKKTRNKKQMPVEGNISRTNLKEPGSESLECQTVNKDIIDNLDRKNTREDKKKESSEDQEIRDDNDESHLSSNRNQSSISVVEETQLHEKDDVLPAGSVAKQNLGSSLTLENVNSNVTSQQNNIKISCTAENAMESKISNQQKIEINRKISDQGLLEARRAFLESKPKEEIKAIHPLRSSDSEEPSDNNDEIEETFEERADRKRKDKEERKQKKKMEEQRAKRFKRMQAFQARSGMQNFMDIDEPHISDDEKQDMDDGSEDGEVVEEGTNFYKSYNELEELEKKKLENASSDNKHQEQKNKQLDDTCTEVCTDSNNSNINKEQNVQKEENESSYIAVVNEKIPLLSTTTSVDDSCRDDTSQGTTETINKKKRKYKEKKKSPEEAQMEGVGFWARMCESQGDFEVPANAKETSSSHAVKKDTRSDYKRHKLSSDSNSSGIKTRSVKHFFPGTSNSIRNKGNIDTPNKEQVDKQQEEMDNLTWADRWYQNKDVKKVMKHSQLMSKVRSNIKIKLKDPDGLSDKITSSISVGPSTTESISPPSVALKTSVPLTKEKSIPEGEKSENIIGSMDEYAKIVGKTSEQLEKEQLEDLDKDPHAEETDEDEGNEDDLWGAIMGNT